MIAALPIIAIWVLVPVLLISGIIRLRKFSLKCLDEYQRTRLEVGKIAEELSLIHKFLENQ